MRTMADVETRNNAIGHHWFEPGTMAFFDSRVESELLRGRWFISSEQFHASDGTDFPRRFALHQVLGDGAIKTLNIGEDIGLAHRSFASLADAEQAVAELR